MEKKTKTEKKLRQEINRQRADAFFGIYYEMGPERSLEKLCQFCAKIGLKRALNTFKRWSALYDWQNRILELDTKLQEEREMSHLENVEAMNKSQAQDARNMRALARGGMSAMANILRATGTIDLSPQDIATLMREGTKIERLAMGEATSRVEAIIYVYNVLLMAIARIFNEINIIRDPIQRRNAFANKLDELRENQIIELEKQQKT